MYDVNKNTAKIYVTYTRPILDEGMKSRIKKRFMLKMINKSKI